MHPFPRPVPFGYRAPSTAGLNSDAPLLDIGAAAGEITLLKEETFFPPKIQLRTLLEAVPLPPSHAQVTLITQGETLSSSFLYQGNHVEPADLFAAAQVQAVKLIYEGKGNYQTDQETRTFQGLETENFRILLAPENVVYTKPFAWERRTNVTERVTQLDHGHVFINPPGKIDISVLRPYGGYFRPHLSADQCCQAYYEISEKGNATLALLKLEPDAQAVLLPPPSPEQALSLSAALAAGHASFILEAGGQKRTYVSLSSRHPGENTYFLDITFVPRP